MIIDCHAHLVPPSLLDAIRTQASNFPSIRLLEDGGSLGFSFAGGKPTRPVSKPLSDLPGRLKWMDEQKIERQVVGGWLDMFGNELPAEEGARWSRLINSHLAQTAGTPRATADRTRQWIARIQARRQRLGADGWARRCSRRQGDISV